VFLRSRISFMKPLMKWNIYIDKRIHQSHNCFIRILSLSSLYFNGYLYFLCKINLFDNVFLCCSEAYIYSLFADWLIHIFVLTRFLHLKMSHNVGPAIQKYRILDYTWASSAFSYIIIRPSDIKMKKKNIQHCRNTSIVPSNNLKKRQNRYRNTHIHDRSSSCLGEV